MESLDCILWSRNGIALVVIEQGNNNCKNHGRETITVLREKGGRREREREKETKTGKERKRQKDRQRQAPSMAFTLPWSRSHALS